MGRLWNSLKGQVGRDAGKVISNLVFKDRHASVYRRAKSRDDNSGKAAQSRGGGGGYESLPRITLPKINLRKSTDSKVSEIVNIDIPDSETGLIKLLDRLMILIKSNPFTETGEDESDEINRYADAVFYKYGQTFARLKHTHPHSPALEYYQKQYKRLKFSRVFGKYGYILLAISILLVIFCIFGINAYLES